MTETVEKNRPKVHILKTN